MGGIDMGSLGDFLASSSQLSYDQLHEKAREFDATMAFNEKQMQEVGIPDEQIKAAQQQAQQAFWEGSIKNAQAQEILSANTGPANPFSYLAKLGGLQQAGSLGNLLGNNIQFATGQSLNQLAAQPAYSNTQLATDLVNLTKGQPVSSAGQSYLQQFLGVSPTPTTTAAPTAGAAQPAGAPGVQPTAAAATTALPAASGNGTTVIGGTHYHLPTGFETSLQDYNHLSPTAQQAALDLQQTAGGQLPQDFLAGLKQASPTSSFKASNSAGLNNVNGL